MKRRILAAVALVVAMGALVLAIVRGGTTGPEPNVASPVSGDSTRDAEGDASTRVRRSSPDAASPGPSTVAIVLRGRVLVADGAPLAWASIRTSSGRRVWSDATGQFLVRASPPIDLAIEASGFASAARHVDAGASAEHDVGDIFLSGLGELGVEVVDSQSRPVEDARVEWKLASSPHASFRDRASPYDDSGWALVGRTDISGSVTARSLPTDRAITVRVETGAPGPATTPPFTIDRGVRRAVRVVLPAPVRLTVDARVAGAEPITPVEVTRLDGDPWARWTRSFHNRSGIVGLDLPGGLYRVAVLVDGSQRLSRDVALDTETTVRFDARQSFRVRVVATAPDGTPLARFHAAVLPSDTASVPVAVPHIVLRGGTTVEGRDGVAHVALADTDESRPPADGRYVVVVWAPGFAISSRTIVARAPGTSAAEVAVMMEAGASFRGVVRGAPPGSEVRLHYRRDPSGASWDSGGAPHVASDTVAAGGTFALPGLGPGTYDVRLATRHGEFGLGEVVAPGSGVTDVSLTYAPATVVVRTRGSRDAVPALYEVRAGNKWSPAETLGERAIQGESDGADVRFDDLPAGTYVVLEAGTSTSVPTDPASRIVLASGETRRLDWTAPERTPDVAIHVRRPPSDVGALFVACVPQSRAPEFAANLSFTPVPDSGRVVVPLERSEPFFVVLAAPPAGVVARNWAIVPRHVTSPIAADARTPVEIALEPTCSVRVRVVGRAPASLQIVSREWARALRDAFPLTPDGISPALSAGSYRVVSGDAQGRTVDTTVVLAADEAGDVTVTLR